MSEEQEKSTTNKLNPTYVKDNSSLIQKTSSFFSSFLSFSKNTETPNDDDQEHQEHQQHIKCEKWKQKLFQSSPVVQFMLEQLKKVGCEFNFDKHFLCAPCDLSRSGGFLPSHGVLLCQNRLMHKQHLQDTLIHELIHAFDHCTTHVNWNNCEQLACSEIRAVSLSGECQWLKELSRGNFAIAKQHQVCFFNFFLLK
jgi:inner membrane protease ATP23